MMPLPPSDNPYGSGSGVSQEQVDASVSAAVAALVDGSPGTLDTLNELAAAIGDDPSFYSTIGDIASGAATDAAAALAAANAASAAAALGLQTLIGRYDFDLIGGDPGNMDLVAPGTTDPVIVDASQTGRVFVAIGCHFFIHNPIIQDGGSLAIGYASNRGAFTAGGAKTAADLKIDPSYPNQFVTNPYAAAQAFATSPGGPDSMSIHVNDSPITAGKVDVIAFGYTLPVGQLT